MTWPSDTGKPPAMRYYIYISDSKLDMLSEQIPPPLRKRVAAELKVDVKIFSLSLRQTESSETRTAKLRLVEAYVDENGLAGTIDEPKAYFRGSLEMRWGPFSEKTWDPDLDNEAPVFFGGQTEKTMVGLGGSQYHLVGRARGEALHSHSGTPFLLRALQREPTDVELEKRDHPDQYFVYRTIEIIVNEERGVPDKVEFLARKLGRFEPPGGGKAVLLGTPIYVALTDAP